MSGGRERRGSPCARLLTVVLIVSSLLATAVPAKAVVEPGNPVAGRCEVSWVPAWSASPTELPPGLLGGQDAFGRRTLRLIVNPNVSGESARVRLSNHHGAGPVVLGPVRLASSAGGAEIDPASAASVTFDGAPTVVVLPGRDVVSDPVPVTVSAFEDLAVSVHLPTAVTPMTGHLAARQVSYLSDPGDHTGASSGDAFSTTITTWPFLSGVEVLPDAPLNTVVTLGDSITDGGNSTPGTNRRWPDALARRMAAAAPNQRMAVANAGISANQVLADTLNPHGGGAAAITRFVRDVTSIPGVTDVIVHEGTNDIGLSGASAKDIIDGLRELARQARAAGIRIHVTTQAPAGGTPGHGDALGVATRQAVNAWTRAHWAEHFDSMFDFGAALADPEDPTRLADRYDAGDHLHPSDAGHSAVAGAVDLDALTGSPCST